MFSLYWVSTHAHTHTHTHMLLVCVYVYLYYQSSLSLSLSLSLYHHLSPTYCDDEQLESWFQWVARIPLYGLSSLFLLDKMWTSESRLPSSDIGTCKWVRSIHVSEADMWYVPLPAWPIRTSWVIFCSLFCLTSWTGSHRELQGLRKLGSYQIKRFLGAWRMSQYFGDPHLI